MWGVVNLDVLSVESDLVCHRKKWILSLHLNTMVLLVIVRAIKMNGVDSCLLWSIDSSLDEWAGRDAEADDLWWMFMTFGHSVWTGVQRKRSVECRQCWHVTCDPSGAFLGHCQLFIFVKIQNTIQILQDRICLAPL